jgi:hypothetical protein
MFGSGTAVRILFTRSPICLGVMFRFTRHGSHAQYWNPISAVAITTSVRIWFHRDRPKRYRRGLVRFLATIAKPRADADPL